MMEGNPRFRLNVFPRVAANSDSAAAAAVRQEFRDVGRLLRSLARSLEDDRDDDLSWMIRSSAAPPAATAETRAAAAVCLADAVVKAAIGAEGHVGFMVVVIGLAAWRLLNRK